MSSDLTSRNSILVQGDDRGAIGVMAGSVNIAAIFSIYRSSPLHNAFGILCAANLLSDIGFLLPEVFWAAPAEILKRPIASALGNGTVLTAAD
ncbi:hypothetical protein ANCCEY_04213 [Ancylostoma ceylanicum]|uniref:7TM GPCR serpentine receptor class x (Srx) domain-containing protein n=1 Tax=Ancylostoma ceylanicum TaxID=53326 RepID=A0A0D6LZQ7_9BILA|nr:hypothetical protein ANCCEY_04213 [Ancylostoma ceylanicum]